MVYAPPKQGVHLLILEMRIKKHFKSNEVVSKANLSSGEFNNWEQSQIGIRIQRGCLGLLRHPLFCFRNNKTVSQDK